MTAADKIYLRCDNCGHVVPPHYLVTDLSDGPVRICGPACGDEIARALKMDREKVLWRQVVRPEGANRST